MIWAVGELKSGEKSIWLKIVVFYYMNQQGGFWRMPNSITAEEKYKKLFREENYPSGKGWKGVKNRWTESRRFLLQ